MSYDKKAARYLSPATAGAMLFGAVVGGVAAAAANARKVKNGELTGKCAALGALREAGTTGLAAGAGVAAMAALRLGGLPGLLGIAAVATGTKYLMDTVLDEVIVKGRLGGLKSACGCGDSTELAAEVVESAPAAAAKTAKVAKVAKTSAKKPAKPRAPRKAAKPKAEPETYITE